MKTHQQNSSLVWTNYLKYRFWFHTVNMFSINKCRQIQIYRGVDIKGELSRKEHVTLFVNMKESKQRVKCHNCPREIHHWKNTRFLIHICWCLHWKTSLFVNTHWHLSSDLVYVDFIELILIQCLVYIYKRSCLHPFS